MPIDGPHTYNCSLYCVINLAFEDKFQITLQPSQEGSSPSLTLEPVNKTKMITSTDVWLQAFHAFVGIFTSQYPHEAPALKEKLDTHLRSINCDRQKANPEIWGRLDWHTRGKDLKYSNLQTTLTKVVI